MPPKTFPDKGNQVTNVVTIPAIAPLLISPIMIRT